MNGTGTIENTFLEQIRNLLGTYPAAWRERPVDLPALFAQPLSAGRFPCGSVPVSGIPLPGSAGILEIVPVPLDFFLRGRDWNSPWCIFEVAVPGKGASSRLWLYEDRWRQRPDFWTSRIGTRLGFGCRVAARKCRIVVPEAAEAARFLAEAHAYGSARARHRLALADDGGLVAVATFSAPRPMLRDGKTVLSWEWIRYASRPGTVAVGGMGRLLSAFVRTVRPQEIMTYADLEWSDGEAYRRLGFRDAGFREPVRFCLDANGGRISLDRLGRDRSFRETALPEGPVLYNRGSLKLLFRPGG